MNSSTKAAHWMALILVTSLSTACITSSATSNPDQTSAPSVNKLAPGDVVEINIFREAELRGAYRINALGEIDFPLLGKVPAAGKDSEELAQELTARLSDGYLTAPQVMVSIVESNSEVVHVLGQVSKPGQFTFRPGMGILHAISLAGGFTNLAASNRVKVTRVTKDGEQRFELRVGDISTGNAPNFPLQQGDVIFTPESLF